MQDGACIHDAVNRLEVIFSLNLCQYMVFYVFIGTRFLTTGFIAVDSIAWELGIRWRFGVGHNECEVAKGAQV
jgi:hypothetical protein